MIKITAAAFLALLATSAFADNSLEEWNAQMQKQHDALNDRIVQERQEIRRQNQMEQQRQDYRQPRNDYDYNKHFFGPAR